MSLTHVLAAIAGGLFPALIWLWFWLREDSKNPEPRRLIVLAFFAGMICVGVAVGAEKAVQPYLMTIGGEIMVFSGWSVIEELLKFFFAYATVLRRAEDDEPIDPVIYMITTALGFAAAENTLFLLSPSIAHTLMQGIETGNLRFVGATLLHVLSSSMIGVAMGFSFYASRTGKIIATTLGVILACTLHIGFNFFILNTRETEIMRVFVFVWIGVIVLLGMLEYIKRIHPRRAR